MEEQHVEIQNLEEQAVGKAAGQEAPKKQRGCCGLWIFLILLAMLAVINWKWILQTTQYAVEEIQTMGIPFSEVELSEQEVEDCYYYSHLEEEDQELYKLILQNVREEAESFIVRPTTATDVSRVYICVMNDWPELFWCTGAIELANYDKYTELLPKYTVTGEQKEARQAEIDAAVQTCLSQISTDTTEYMRVKQLYEYLINTVEYRSDSTDNQNIYSALVNKASVCAGYSRAMQYLLRKVGVECLYVHGQIPERGSHAWNIVKCDGQYYNVDVTFGDPLFVQEDGTSQPGNTISYTYLCCADEPFQNNHQVDTSTPMPACTSMDLNYYVLGQTYFTSYDRSTLLEAMNGAIYRGERSFVCQFAGAEAYAAGYEGIVSDLLPTVADNLMMFYNMSSVAYTYSQDASMYTVSVSWEY